MYANQLDIAKFRTIPSYPIMMQFCGEGRALFKGYVAEWLDLCDSLTVLAEYGNITLKEY